MPKDIKELTQQERDEINNLFNDKPELAAQKFFDILKIEQAEHDSKASQELFGKYLYEEFDKLFKLDRKRLAEYLGKESIKAGEKENYTRKAFIANMRYPNTEFKVAFRHFISNIFISDIPLQVEGQVAERILDDFADQYVLDNPRVFLHSTNPKKNQEIARAFVMGAFFVHQTMHDKKLSKKTSAKMPLNTFLDTYSAKALAKDFGEGNGFPPDFVRDVYLDLDKSEIVHPNYNTKIFFQGRGIPTNEIATCVGKINQVDNKPVPADEQLHFAPETGFLNINSWEKFKCYFLGGKRQVDITSKDGLVATATINAPSAWNRLFGGAKDEVTTIKLNVLNDKNMRILGLLKNEVDTLYRSKGEHEEVSKLESIRPEVQARIKELSTRKESEKPGIKDNILGLVDNVAEKLHGAMDQVVEFTNNLANKISEPKLETKEKKEEIKETKSMDKKLEEPKLETKSSEKWRPVPQTPAPERKEQKFMQENFEDKKQKMDKKQERKVDFGFSKKQPPKAPKAKDRPKFDTRGYTLFEDEPDSEETPTPPRKGDKGGPNKLYK